MIRLDSQHGRLATLAADCLAIGLFDDGQFTDAASQLDTASKGQLRKLRESGDLPSRLGDSQLLLQLAGVRARRILVIGLGKRADFNRRGWRTGKRRTVTAPSTDVPAGNSFSQVT